MIKFLSVSQKSFYFIGLRFERSQLLSHHTYCILRFHKLHLLLTRNVLVGFGFLDHHLENIEVFLRGFDCVVVSSLSFLKLNWNRRI